MRNFEVSTDSTSDLYASEVKELGVFVGRLSYILDDNDNITEHKDDFRDYQDYVDFYNTLRRGVVAKTSILNVETHVEMFTKMAEAGIKNAIHIAQSYGLSPTLDNANKAIEIVKEKFPDINYVAMESRTSSFAEGMLVKIACRMRDEGKSLIETLETLERIKMNIQHFIIADDLMYLKRGGRISGPKAAIGTLLNLKPIIEFSKEGKLEVIRKEVGMKKAMRSIIEEAKKYTRNDIYPNGVVVHTDNLAAAKEMQALVKQTFGYEPEIRIIGPIIGSHLGSNCVAFTFISNEERPL